LQQNEEESGDSDQPRSLVAEAGGAGRVDTLYTLQAGAHAAHPNPSWRQLVID
jgi:hypothetical protein